MAQTPYDFSRSQPASGIFRKILIFCGVSAGLAGGIYLVMPTVGSKTAVPETAVPETAAPETAAPETAAPETENVQEEKSRKNTAAVLPAEQREQTGSAAASGSGQTAKSDAGQPVSVTVENKQKNTPAAETAAAPAAIPVQKDVPHPTDPADEESYFAPDLLEPAGFKENLRAIRELMKNGKNDIAETRLLALLAETAFSSPEYREAAKELNKVHARQAHSAKPAMQPYTVQKGDTLIRLARKHQIAAARLAEVNHLPPDARLRTGQKLQIPSGSTWSVRVNKRARLLRVYRGDTLYSVYDIGIGRRNLTPEGKFTIREVIDDPPYPKLHVGMVPGGSPRNPLGPCWIGLGDEQNRATGYGIHGTTDEHTVTRDLSSGCIRMRNAEVKILRGLLPVGTPVVIEP